MPVPQTPKSSTLVKPPKTPKSQQRASANGKKRPKEQDHLKPSKSKKQKPNEKVPKTTVSKVAPSTDPQSKKIKKQQKKDTGTPSTASKKKPQEQVSKPERKTVVDQVIAEGGEFYGQKCKHKRFQDQIKQEAITLASGQVFHYDTGKESDLPELDEMTLAYLAQYNPVKKIKFSGAATQYFQLMNESNISDFCKGLKVFMQQSNRQTLTLNEIHAERTYRGLVDWDANKTRKCSKSESRKRLVEDMMQSHASNDPDKIQMKPGAWKECCKIDAIFNSESDAPPLSQVATALYGSTSSFPEQ